MHVIKLNGTPIYRSAHEEEAPRFLGHLLFTLPATKVVVLCETTGHDDKYFAFDVQTPED